MDVDSPPKPKSPGMRLVYCERNGAIGDSTFSQCRSLPCA
jgi:hypothetical protein